MNTLPLAFLDGVDPWIFALSLITVGFTIYMGFRSAKTSKTAGDFFVAGRSVSVRLERIRHLRGIPLGRLLHGHRRNGHGRRL